MISQFWTTAFTFPHHHLLLAGVPGTPQLLSVHYVTVHQDHVPVHALWNYLLLLFKLVVNSISLLYCLLKPLFFTPLLPQPLIMK